MKKDIKQDIKHKIWEVGSFSLLGILYYWVFTEIINWDEIESKTGYTCLEEKECEGLKKWWSEPYKSQEFAPHPYPIQAKGGCLGPQGTNPR